MSERRSTYLAFMLRIRWAENAGQPVWRISVERPGQPGQVRLESLAALCAYLTAQTQNDEEEGGDLEENEGSSSPDSH